MNLKGMSKNIFMALTIISVVALIVFLIQLIVINSGEDTREPESVVSAASPEAGENSGDGEGMPDSEAGGQQEIPTAPQTQRPAPQGTRYEIVVDTGVTLIIYAEEEKFDYIEEDLVWLFDYKGGGNAALDIGFVLLSANGPGAEAEAYLNDRLGENIAEYKGEHPIIDSVLRGYNAQAQREGTTYETWVYRLPGGADLALAFTLNYDFTGQRDDLYEVLSSMSIEQG